MFKKIFLLFLLSFPLFAKIISEPYNSHINLIKSGSQYDSFVETYLKIGFNGNIELKNNQEYDLNYISGIGINYNTYLFNGIFWRIGGDISFISSDLNDENYYSSNIYLGLKNFEKINHYFTLFSGVNSGIKLNSNLDNYDNENIDIFIEPFLGILLKNKYGISLHYEYARYSNFYNLQFTYKF
jgi:hypothetical protein